MLAAKVAAEIIKHKNTDRIVFIVCFFIISIRISRPNV